MPTVSILTAFLNEATNLPSFRERVLAVVHQLALDYEIVLIDDHSTDGSSQLAKTWAAEDTRVKYIRLSRNCGSHAAYSAGLAKCAGDCAILLAADLQDPPEMIPDFLARRQGFDVVWAARSARPSESWLTRFLAGVYYRTMRTFALPDMPAKGADCLLMERKVIDAYNAISERNTSFLAMVLWLGFRQTSFVYEKQARHSGRTKWNLGKKIKLFIDSIVSFSYTPIRLASAAGIGISFLGFLYAGLIIFNAFRGERPAGWASTMVVVLLLGGFQLTMLGILGEYLWRAFDEARGRPRYIIEEYIASEPAKRGLPKTRED